MKKQHQEELLAWAKVAIKQLEKNSDDDLSCRNHMNGGKALIKEIENEKN